MFKFLLELPGHYPIAWEIALDAIVALVIVGVGVYFALTDEKKGEI